MMIWKRVAIASAVVLAQVIALFTAGIVAGPRMLSLDSLWYTLVDAVITVGIVLVAPACAFWATRHLVREARSISWVGVVGLVALTDLVIATLMYDTPLEDQRRGVALTLASVICPFIAALLGTFVPAGFVTFGVVKTEKRGPWIS
jgi:hypothetical protein